MHHTSEKCSKRRVRDNVLSLSQRTHAPAGERQHTAGRTGRASPARTASAKSHTVRLNPSVRSRVTYLKVHMHVCNRISLQKRRITGQSKRVSQCPHSYSMATHSCLIPSAGGADMPRPRECSKEETCGMGGGHVLSLSPRAHAPAGERQHTAGRTGRASPARTRSPASSTTTLVRGCRDPGFCFIQRKNILQNRH